MSDILSLHYQCCSLRYITNKGATTYPGTNSSSFIRVQLLLSGSTSIPPSRHRVPISTLYRHVGDGSASCSRSGWTGGERAQFDTGWSLCLGDKGCSCEELECTGDRWEHCCVVLCDVCVDVRMRLIE